MKKIFSVLLVFTAALLLVACKTGDNNSPVDENGKNGENGEIVDFSELRKQKVTITVWIDDEQGDYMDAVIEAFNEVEPNIHVQHYHKGSVDSREHLKTFGPSGNGADVFQFPHDHLSSAILEDLVLALPSDTKNLIDETAHELGASIATLYYDEVNKSFDPSSPNAVERLYAVPMSVEAVGLYYNKALIDTPATTYEDLLAAGAVWNETNAIDGNYYLGTTSHWADSYFIQHIYSAFGFTPFGLNLNNPSKVGFEDLDLALKWMNEKLKPIATGGQGTGSVSGGQRFEEGKIPYVIGGPWNIEGFVNNKIDFGIAKLPSINGVDTKPFAGAMMAAVYKYSKNAVEAIKFVEFLNSPTAMDLQFEYKRKLPALKSDLLSDAVRADEALMAMSRQLESAVPMPTIPQVQYYWGPGEAMVKEVWNNDIPILDALIEAEKGYRTLANLGN